MELWYAPTSPFARKVRIAAHELGLAGCLRLVEVTPWTDARLRALNPLSKVPTLVLDSGEVLYESGVLCEYRTSTSAGRNTGGAPPIRASPPGSNRSTPAPRCARPATGSRRADEPPPEAFASICCVNTVEGDIPADAPPLRALACASHPAAWAWRHRMGR
ncbi:glutathione S-transferase N-terminal domain-containing protein [Stigmatella hybrida]|uniref:glutathione S-transferase N-terminal domain-containing protein n=1 Tax=Stigmatella hybrida TaxID=394097 RepID=UPI001CDB374C